MILRRFLLFYPQQKIKNLQRLEELLKNLDTGISSS